MGRYRDDGEVQIDNSTNGRFQNVFQWLSVIAALNVGTLLGSALELREALREILDRLAPDSEVIAAPGYVQEQDRAGPTMKQKVRFIMKKKGKRSSSDAPEQAVTAFEEAIAALTRAVYERSSQATHVASERQTVVQLRRYVGMLSR
jgi:uncharacterized membrane protein affecting hemolysin expression